MANSIKIIKITNFNILYDLKLILKCRVHIIISIHSIQKLYQFISGNSYTMLNIENQLKDHSIKLTPMIPAIETPEESVLISILSTSAEVSRFLRSSPTVKLQSSNDFGDQQLEQDVHCDFIIEKYLRANNQIDGMASQERPKYLPFTHKTLAPEGKPHYVVTFDPLDGSSIVDVNFAIGSIYSIWNNDPKDPSPIIGKSLRTQENAVIVIYGSRTTAVLYNSAKKKVQEYTLIETYTHHKEATDEWVLSKEECVIGPKTKIFAPGNSRAASEHGPYLSAIEHWIKKGYTLRYSGGLAPDVYQLFIKGNGIFTCLISPSHKAKLRLVYQVAAMGFLIEKAGGKCLACKLQKGSKQNGTNVMDLHVKGFDDRLGFVGGSSQEVDYLVENKCLEGL